MIEITLDDRALRAALDRLRSRVEDTGPAMHDIGQTLMERARRRFATSTGPDGQAWEPNAPATIAAYLGRYGGSYKKDGSLSKRGAARAAGKKPLIGESKQLQNIHYAAGRDWAEVGSSRIYAAIHQLGGQAGRGKSVTIPARPFLPVTQDGQWIGADDRAAILDILSRWIEGRPL
ncbi:phage virion morphogenesis protein [Sulfuritortus calidifontis]|uniref:Phage virion morphogenesis protein n=2 Tax=Sulfuritortus calidifontis TaxID=1914471 RepID=A0A4R3JTR0_9PROT|nr:phage virion morphogenesis protein [Sulfuritortus calidifontis]